MEKSGGDFRPIHPQFGQINPLLFFIFTVVFKDLNRRMPFEIDFARAAQNCSKLQTICNPSSEV